MVRTFSDTSFNRARPSTGPGQNISVGDDRDTLTLSNGPDSSMLNLRLQHPLPEIVRPRPLSVLLFHERQSVDRQRSRSCFLIILNLMMASEKLNIIFSQSTEHCSILSPSNSILLNRNTFQLYPLKQKWQTAIKKNYLVVT